MRKILFLVYFCSFYCLFANSKFSQSLFFGKDWDISNFYEGQDNKPFICIIQDVHCNEEVQYKIYKIISLIKNRYPEFNLIGIEGNNGVIDTSILRDMTDLKLKKQMCQDLMKKGMMTGAEYYDINNPKKIVLYGIESIDIYNKNLSQIKKGLFGDSYIIGQINIMKMKNKNSKDIFYKKRLYDMDSLHEKYRSGSVSLDVLLKKIMKDLDYKESNMMNFPNILLFLKKKDVFQKIDFSSLNLEFSNLIQLVSKHIPSSSLKKLKILSKSGGREFYNYFIDTLSSENIIVDRKFYSINLYISYLDIDRRLDNVELLNEVDKFIFLAKNLLAETVQEKEILYLDKYTTMFEDYVNNNVTSKQTSEMNAEFDRFLQRIKNRYGELNDAAIKKHFEYMRDFYDTAIKRNEVMLGNLLKVLNTDISAIIVGGFHTEGIEELLRSKGSGYVVFTPKINLSIQEGRKIYLSRMKEETGL